MTNKKGYIFIAVVLIALLFYGFTFWSGKTSKCEIVPIESNVYTEEDYRAACKVAFGYFRRHFAGCTMTSIRYVGDDNLDAMKEYAEGNGVDEVIILESDFNSGNRQELGLNPNDEYTDWQWILIRNKGGKWRHRDHGYG